MLVSACGIGVLRLMFSRTREFRAQAQLGQPIVRAVEDYKEETGSYPASLGDLAPTYLPAVPEVPDVSRCKFGGWDYQMETNNGVASYRLRYYLGWGGIEYRPPHWIGNNEGSRNIIFSNE